VLLEPSVLSILCLKQRGLTAAQGNTGEGKVHKTAQRLSSMEHYNKYWSVVQELVSECDSEQDTNKYN
jgi:Tfp pilus assembly ATPase PilU